jgi:hypothetical protein
VPLRIHRVNFKNSDCVVSWTLDHDAGGLRATEVGSAAKVRANDFPSVRGYDPGYPIPYDPNDPYLALDYINDQFDGVWTDVYAGQLSM